MLDVETNHQIILLYFKEGLSQRKIAQQLKISRKTVKARVVEYERFKSQSASEDPTSVSATAKYLTEGPAYDSSNRAKRKLTLEIADRALLVAAGREELSRKYEVHPTHLEAGVSEQSLRCIQ